MAKIDVVQYVPDHFEMMKNTSTYYASLATHYGLTNESMAQLYLRGPAFTMFADGQIVGCGGVIKLWPGVGDAWLLTTPLVFKYPLAVHKTVMFKLNEIIQNLRLTRVQCIVVMGFETGHRWIKRLGFKEEGMMKNFFAGQDYMRYSLTPELEE